ncbi:MAG: shikimate dehydrogenase [bacterium]
MICIPITSCTTEAALEGIRQAEETADILELRIDYLVDPDLSRILKTRRLPVIVTNRRAGEGGKYEGSEVERLSILEEAVSLGAEHIDLEWSCGAETIYRFKELIRGTKTRLICSWHDFRGTPQDLTELYLSMRSMGVDIVKIVTMANAIHDNVKIFDLVYRAWEDKQDIIALCMGAYGEISRILTPLLGSYLTFGSLQEGKESAPGQIEARILRDIYRIPELEGSDFHLYGLVGNPVNQSKGFRLHNRAFQHLGLDKIYVNFLVDEVTSFIQSFKGYISGLSVTMPHKQSIMNCLNRIDPLAQRIGAVNTVVKKGGSLIGYNTDCMGAIQAIEAVIPLEKKKVTLLGAGGVSRAVAWGVVDRGAILTILNRTVSKAQELAGELGCQAGSLEESRSLDCDLLINGTSIGMAPQIDEMPIPDSSLKSEMVVFDTIYNPAQTRLLREAQARGCRTISGLEMFLYQAAAQFNLWTGLPAPIEIMRSALG